MQQPSWYLKRLRRMSGAEVAYRLARSVRTVSTQFTSHTLPPRDAFATDFRFLPPFVSLSPDALIGAAERVLADRYSFFDLADCELGDPPPETILHVGDDWAADVVGASRAGWRVGYVSSRPRDSPLPSSKRDGSVVPDLEIETIGDLAAALGAGPTGTSATEAGTGTR